jgi:cysteine desulfurase
MATIYLDHNATTPVDPEVVEAMLPFLSGDFGNASSVHQFGRAAKVGLERAREQIAGFINAHPSEIYFTSGGTESDNLALFGTVRRLKARRNHLIVTSTEHHAILEPAEYLHKYEDFDLDLLPVDGEGFADQQKLAELVTDKTSFVSVMHANNETGVIQNTAALAETAKEKGAIFHTDAVQATGKIPVDVKALGVDMLSLTAHKIYGPKGIGALFVRQGLKFEPLMHGGSHEKKRRPGTENVAGAVGLAKALEIAGKCMQADHTRHGELADYFINRLLEIVPETRLNGPRSRRVPPTVNVSFTGIEGESVVLSLDMENIAVSSGSACTSGAVEPSHVLTAMGIPAVTARGSVRFSMGRSTTREQLDHVLTVLPPIVARLREMSPVYKK